MHAIRPRLGPRPTWHDHLPRPRDFLRRPQSPTRRHVQHQPILPKRHERHRDSDL